MPARHGIARRVAWTALAFAAALATASAASPDPSVRKRADGHVRKAETLLRRGDPDSRRFAIQELEQATLLVPDDARAQLSLARTYYQVGFLKSARQRFERAASIAPDDAEARYGLGQVWRRDWLKYLDRTSLRLAIENLSTCCRLRSDHGDGWLLLVPLLVEQRDLRAAAAAAARGHEADPRRPEGLLAQAYTAQRLGELARADSLFRASIPRLVRSARERFEDISPVASARDTFTLHRLPPDEQPAFLERFWKSIDPDLTTPLNEARLEYWSRAAHAYFLFFDPRRREWDERGEVFVRYGAPEGQEYNPVNSRLSFSFGTGPAFPANVLVWDYPSLGMKVTMHDRLLSEYYLLPISRWEDMDPQPDADSLARRTDQLATAGGRGLFPLLPPGVRPLPIHGQVARFAGQDGARLVGHVDAPGDPADSLWGEMVVLDSTQREVARAARALEPSLCDAAELRFGEFGTDLPPGEYTVGLAVQNARGARGVFRTSATIAAPGSRLALSDVVIACGPPEVQPGSPPVIRLAGNPAAVVAPGEPLIAYFEIYRLSPDARGQSRFEYVYTVRSAEKDPRIWIQRAFAPRAVPPPIVASREEENPGTLRRQSVSVPVQSMPPGKYRIEIAVRDLQAGTEAKASAEFVKRAS